MPRVGISKPKSTPVTAAMPCTSRAAASSTASTMAMPRGIFVAAIVDSSQLEPLRVPELRQLARHSYRAGDVKTCGNLVVQALVRTLVVEHVSEVIEAALPCAKGCRRWFGRVLLQSAMHPLVAAVLLRSTCLNAFVHDTELHPSERELRQP